MNPRVSVPKIFLRGNKWYVRVQVPKSMQERLKRKEYWVSLRTSDRAEALQHATAATQKKRREISAVYRRLADIKLEEKVWGFDVTHISTTGDDDKSVKTGSSIRFVPIHPRLIEFGLLEFHGARPRDAKLFGDIARGVDGYYSTNFSKKVNRYLKRIGAHGPKHKFHSFRHNFRDALRKGRVDREIGKALGGWTGGNTDAFDIYGNGYEVNELKDEIARVDYPHVDWSII